MKAVALYTLVRFGLIAAFIALFWVFNFRGIVPVLFAVVLSMLVSYLAFGRLRTRVVEAFARRDAPRAAQRDLARSRPRGDKDGDWEDSIVADAESAAPPRPERD